MIAENNILKYVKMITKTTKEASTQTEELKTQKVKKWCCNFCSKEMNIKSKAHHLRVCKNITQEEKKQYKWQCEGCEKTMSKKSKINHLKICKKI